MRKSVPEIDPTRGLRVPKRRSARIGVSAMPFLVAGAESNHRHKDF